MVDRYNLIDLHDNKIKLGDRASESTRAAFAKISAGHRVGEVELTVDDVFNLPPAEGGGPCRLRVLIRRQRRGLPVKAMRINLPFACEPATGPGSTSFGDTRRPASNLLQACAQYVRENSSRDSLAVQIYTHEALSTVIKYKWTMFGQRMFLEEKRRYIWMCICYWLTVEAVPSFYFLQRHCLFSTGGCPHSVVANAKTNPENSLLVESPFILYVVYIALDFLRKEAILVRITVGETAILLTPPFHPY